MGIALGQVIGTSLPTSIGIDLAPRSTFALTPDDIIAVGERKMWARADQGITLNGSRVSGWSNIWANGNYAQATAGAQPLYDATGLNHRAALYADDLSRFMGASFSSNIPIGSRMYLWAYCRLAAVGTGNRYFASIGTGTTPRCYAATASAGNWRLLNHNGTTGAALADSGIPCDLNRHLVEAGLTTGGTNQLVVSGAGVSTTNLNVTTANVNATVLFSSSGVSGGGQGWLGEVVVMLGEPTAQQKSDMRRYFETYYGTI